MARDDLRNPDGSVIARFQIAGGLPAAAALLVVTLGCPQAAEEAAAIRFSTDPKGCVTSWLLAGPLAPEVESPPPAKCPAAGALVKGAEWRVHVSDGAFREPGGSRLGRSGVSLTAALRPRRSGTFFAHATIESKEGGARRIEAGSYGAVKVWLNSEEVLDVAPDEYAWMGVGSAEVKLKPGPNTVFLRLTGRFGVAGYFFRVGDGSPDDRIVLSTGTADGAGPDARLAEALRFVTDAQVVTKDAPVAVALGLLGGTPEVKGGLSVRFRAHAGGRTIATVSGGKLDLERLRTEPVVTRIGLAGAEEPSITIAAELIRDGRTVAAKSMGLFCVEGLSAGLKKLDGQVAAAEKDIGRRIPVARLALAKARLHLAAGTKGATAERAHGEYERAMRAIADARAGKSPYPKSGYAELAYFSEIEQDAQPYLVYIPTVHAREPEKRLPLVVYLHGYVPDYDKHRWLTEDPEMNAVMEAEGCLLAVPFGRSNTDFMTAGEVDVLEVVEEMKRHYPVDESRIYLYGYSMGGSGVWTITTHYPGVFAAGCAIAGRTDYYLWFDLKREDVPPWVRMLIETDNPIDMTGNIADVPVLVFHGTADTLVKKAHSTRMVEKLGGQSELRWMEGGDHWSGFDAVLAKPDSTRWMKRFSKAGFPESVSFKTMSPKYGRSHWVEITEFRRWGEPAEVTAEVKEATIVVKTKNVAAFRLMGVVEKRFAAVSTTAVDGGTYAVEPVKSKGFALRLEGDEPPKGLAKTALRPGPVKEAFNAPFIITYGTRGTEDERLDLQAKALAWQEWWFAFAKSRPPLAADRDVTDEMMKRRSVICFGTPETHEILARAAPKLPVKFPGAGKVRIAGRDYSMTDRGLIFCYPNPLADTGGRYVVCLAGITYGETLSVNHRLDFVPDFLLFESFPQVPREDWPVFWVPEYYKAGKAVVAGFFDRRWRFSERLTWRYGQ